MIRSGSPFYAWRKKAGVAATELAMSLGISKTHLNDLERGTAPLSSNLQETIAEIGIDAEQFRASHDSWMEKRRLAVIEKLKVKL